MKVTVTLMILAGYSDSVLISEENDMIGMRGSDTYGAQNCSFLQLHFSYLNVDKMLFQLIKDHFYVTNAKYLCTQSDIYYIAECFQMIQKNEFTGKVRG